MKNHLIVTTFAGLLSCICAQAELPALNKTLGHASAHTKGETLTVSTGTMLRQWTWTGTGLTTTGLRDLRSGKEWIKTASKEPSDWKFPGIIEGEGQLLSITAKPSNDEGFTSKHLEITAEVSYPKTGVTLKYVIWAYPDAPGLRTQIWLKGPAGLIEPGLPEPTGDAHAAIKVVSGKSRYLPKAFPEFKVAKPYDKTSLFAPQSLELKIEGMNNKSSYKVGASWWDTGKGVPRIQSIKALSMDGESSVTVVKPTTLPSWRNKKRAGKVLFNIPEEVRIGDTVSLQIIKNKGPNVCLSELWLYEKGTSPKDLHLAGNQGRVMQLQKLAPQGYYLVSYLECGAKTPKEDKSRLTESNRRVDFLPITQGKLIAFGYYNDTQHRHTTKDHMSRKEVMDGPSVGWASVLFIQDDHGGIGWVKESHKCVNRAGVDTGSFTRNATGLSNTGAALSAQYLTPNEYRWCWATWTILYPEASADQRELAMKQFDRARYPIDPKRDIWVKANTWGSGNTGDESKNMAHETEVLKEIDSVVDLGIDVLQIDDGWQKGRSKEPDAKTREWHTRDDWYPDGWKNVRSAASKKGLTLGIWTAARAELSDLKRNYDEGGFLTWKYDFAHIANYDNLYDHWTKLRSFLKYTGHKARMAVDVTENAPRFGYFWARDFGCVWLANRKPNNPGNTVPQPTLMLRENRELAEYVNLNKFELTIQNYARVSKTKSDAHLYGHSYEVAMGMMGIPTFFQTTSHYKGAARDEVREMVKIYKNVQRDLYARYVFAIGDVPNGSAISGFQWVDPKSDTGYLLIFRERLNKTDNHELVLRFLKPGTRLELTDLRTGKKSKVTLNKNRAIPLHIKNPADIAFIRYVIKS